MAKVRFSLKQILTIARGFTKVGPDIIGNASRPYMHFEWSLEAAVDQEFMKELDNEFGAEADAPQLEGIVDVGASVGVGAETELQQDARVLLRLKGGARNWIEPS